MESLKTMFRGSSCGCNKHTRKNKRSGSNKRSRSNKRSGSNKRKSRNNKRSGYKGGYKSSPKSAGKLPRLSTTTLKKGQKVKEGNVIA
jgi:hypothetical protein